MCVLALDVIEFTVKVPKWQYWQYCNDAVPFDKVFDSHAMLAQIIFHLQKRKTASREYHGNQGANKLFIRDAQFATVCQLCEHRACHK